ncbi:hypothetical protein GCM10010215_04850 [Streptomyces virginiae]|uniref:Uncharacterized protein n=1 Tax=Streptomyces virginiae TaxID=1961 RepID=A0ABQ3NLR2_STRVG|nr:MULTISPECIES: hypothetical protein [Streptomyces]MBP2342399.1 hypothetical protein [Streptomyces virginiae]MCI4079848.1 hypothetical protein [Streptomyces sp. MMS21 TC-5]GGP82494.1 hypothetical protein GCM10010215_04850 [Streptomyces virginiae]GHI13718.1 hypothetical protein Scinn_31810 [Streptomyces virginiae]
MSTTSTTHTILGAMSPESGRSVSTAAADVIADRPDAARTRLLDLFPPHGSGTPPAHAR